MNVQKAYVRYFAALLMFGTNGVLASLIHLDSYAIVFTRTLIGSLFLVAISIATRQKARLFVNKSHAGCLLLSGLAMGASWMFLYEAYRQIGVSLASLAYYCGPVIVMILSPLLFRERLTWAKAAGFGVVLAGMLGINIQVLSDGQSTWGLFCGIMSALMYALMVILNKKASSLTGLTNATGQMLAALLVVAAFVGLKQGFYIPIDPASWLPVLVLGVINTGVGCYLYFSAIGQLPAQAVAVGGYLEPLSAVFFSVLLLRESLSVVQIIGAVLVLGGAIFTVQAEPGFHVPRRKTAPWT